MPSKFVIYMDSCSFIDAVKHDVGILPQGRADDVWHIKKLMEANLANEISVVTSFLTLAECVAIEAGQAVVPKDVQEHFRRLLISGQYVNLLQQTPKTARIAQDLRWRHQLVLSGADALHFAAAIEASAIEFITTDQRLDSAKVTAAIPALQGLGLRVTRGADTRCLPGHYSQGEMNA